MFMFNQIRVIIVYFMQYYQMRCFRVNRVSDVSPANTLKNEK
jgi:hypothetical protein